MVLPEIILALYSRILEHQDPAAIYLLPAHERLSSDLRTVYNPELGLHVSFAWLGHGALIHKSLARDFLLMMQHLNVTNEEMQMADNYFSILRNTIPEAWFDQGIELGGGQPFTVGTEGEARNNRHIVGYLYGPT